MNCQQICKNLHKKNLTEVKIFQKILGRLLFFETPGISLKILLNHLKSLMVIWN